MRDRLLIYAGLAAFLLLSTMPVWLGMARKSQAVEPQLRRAPQGSACVAEKGEMRRSHMVFLQGWRDGKVRQGRHQQVTADGRSFEVSLSTCLSQCHGSAEEFCIRCHDYAGVPAVGCWRCHVSPPKGSPVAALERVAK